VGRNEVSGGTNGAKGVTRATKWSSPRRKNPKETKKKRKVGAINSIRPVNSGFFATKNEARRSTTEKWETVREVKANS